MEQALLVAEVRRLRAILNRVFEHVTVPDAEMEAEVLEIRQERRGAAVAERASSRDEDCSQPAGFELERLRFIEHETRLVLLSALEDLDGVEGAARAGAGGTPRARSRWVGRLEPRTCGTARRLRRR